MMRSAVAKCCSALLVVSQMSRASDAFAQNSPAAEELYRRGVTDFQAGRYEVACQELADSYRMEELPGVLFTLSTCEARAGRVASAAAHYRDFLDFVSKLTPAQRLPQAEREEVARREREQLLPRVPHLTLQLDKPLPTGAAVSIDGNQLGAGLIGRELPVDPGAHSLTVRLLDGASSRLDVQITEAERRKVTLVVPAPLPVALAPPSAAPTASGSSVMPWMVVSGTLGGVGIAAGSIAGIVAIEQKSIVDVHCDGAACDATGAAAGEKGKTAALISTVGFGVGLGGLAALLILELTRDGEPAAATVGRGPRWSERWVFTGDGVALRETF